MRHETSARKWQTISEGPCQVGRTQARSPNHSTQLLKDTILEAATRAGKGDIVAYLERQAEENPVAFLGLLGRVLPLQLQGDSDRPLSSAASSTSSSTRRSPSLIDQARAKSRTRNVTAIVHWLPHGKLKTGLDG